MLSNKEKKKIQDFVVKFGKEAIEQQKEIEFNTKNDGVDVVSQMDLKIERKFFELVSKNFPSYGFYGEEFSELRKDSEYVWTIDPIDGTKYYAAQIPLWTISIALLKNSEPIYGLIYYPAMDQLFEAEEGKGAFLNKVKLVVKKKKDRSKLQLSWDCPSFKKFDDKTREKITKELNLYQNEYYRVRDLGNACLSICWLLTGFFGAYVKYAANQKEILDNYAGDIIAKEAGVKIFKDNSTKGVMKIIYQAT